MKLSKLISAFVATLLFVPLFAHSEDIDLFMGLPSDSTGKPNVLFIVDNAANWSRNSPAGGPYADQITAALRDVFDSLPADRVNVGVMFFAESGTSGEDGGVIRAAIRPMDYSTKTLYGRAIAALDGTHKSNNSKVSLTFAEAYYYFARARFHQGDMDAAADYFAKAAEVNPDDYQSRLLRVQILRGQGRLDEAKVEAREAIAVVKSHLEWHPDDVRALHLGAGSLIMLGEEERADRWLRRALEVDPSDSIVLYNVACNYAIMGRAEASLDYLENVIENGTVSPDWMRNDSDLESLHGHPRYEALLAQASN